jgi:hypothetical protein
MASNRSTFPGIFAAYDTGRQRRVQIDADAAPDPARRPATRARAQHARHYGQDPCPGLGRIGGGQQPTEPLRPLHKPRRGRYSARSGFGAPGGSGGASTAPVAASPGALTAPTLPATPSTPPSTWSEANQGVVGQLMTVDPEHAAQLAAALQGDGRRHGGPGEAPARGNRGRGAATEHDSRRGTGRRIAANDAGTGSGWRPARR